MLIFRGSRSQIFSKQMFLKNSQYWSIFFSKVVGLLYGTPKLAASAFSRQQIPFSVKSGMYWRESHRFLSRTPLKTRVKRKINYPFKWIQSNGNWVVYFKKFDNFRLIHLSWTCSTFHPTFFYCYH